MSYNDVKKPRFLIIRRANDEIVNAISYRGKSARQAGIIRSGLERQMNHLDFLIRDDP